MQIRIIKIEEEEENSQGKKKKNKLEKIKLQKKIHEKKKQYKEC